MYNDVVKTAENIHGLLNVFKNILYEENNKITTVIFYETPMV
jgi:hypothetical protein